MYTFIQLLVNWWFRLVVWIPSLCCSERDYHLGVWACDVDANDAWKTFDVDSGNVASKDDEMRGTCREYAFQPCPTMTDTPPIIPSSSSHLQQDDVRLARHEAIKLRCSNLCGGLGVEAGQGVHGIKKVIYLEPRLLFWKVHPPKQGLNSNQNNVIWVILVGGFYVQPHLKTDLLPSNQLFRSFRGVNVHFHFFLDVSLWGCDSFFNLAVSN